MLMMLVENEVPFCDISDHVLIFRVELNYLIKTHTLQNTEISRYSK